jgi:hypothetical protein
MGLGLAQARAFVERQGGWIQLQSELGVGTAIQLIFPRVPEEETAGPMGKLNDDDSCSHSAQLRIGYTPSRDGGVLPRYLQGGNDLQNRHLRGTGRRRECRGG